MINVSNLRFADQLCEALPELFSRVEGICIDLTKRDKVGYSFSVTGNQVQISSSDDSATMLALADVMVGKTEAECDIALPFRGLMLDASRNGVPKVSFLKPAIVRLALMGMNHFCLYTEDTFAVDGEPLIGYARGAYSKDEIRELVEFSAALGITMFPCFQTLGHLEQTLKYQKYECLHDNHRVLNTTIDETYDFLEKLIDNVREPYNTNLIHLGMDEPWGIGRGKSFNQDNPKAPSQMYVEHVARVSELCKRKGLESIIWGDYVLGHPEAGTTADKALDSDAIAGLPEDVILDYWNYFDTDIDPYICDIAAFDKMGYEIIASPGLQGWNNYWGQLPLCESVTTPFIDAAKRAGVKRAMMTIWGDDGHECLFHNNWAAVAHFFAECIGGEGDTWKDRLEAITGSFYENQLVTSKIESPQIPLVGKTPFKVTAKMLFYDDPLMGLVNRMFSDDSVCNYYNELCRNIDELNCSTAQEEKRCELAAQFSQFISDKFRLIRDTRLSYLNGSLDAKVVTERCHCLSMLLTRFRAGYRKQWMLERKPFGYEVLDIRFGGMIARIDTLKNTVNDYCRGDIDSIPEFEFDSCNELTYKDLQFYPKITTKCFSIW